MKNKPILGKTFAATCILRTLVIFARRDILLFLKNAHIIRGHWSANREGTMQFLIITDNFFNASSLQRFSKEYIEIEKNIWHYSHTTAPPLRTAISFDIPLQRIWQWFNGHSCLF